MRATVTAAANRFPGADEQKFTFLLDFDIHRLYVVNDKDIEITQDMLTKYERKRDFYYPFNDNDFKELRNWYIANHEVLFRLSCEAVAYLAYKKLYLPFSSAMITKYRVEWHNDYKSIKKILQYFCNHMVNNSLSFDEFCALRNRLKKQLKATTYALSKLSYLQAAVNERAYEIWF